MTVRAEYLAGQAAGNFTAPPLGVILHGSRGGASSIEAEYRGTVSWAAGNPDGLGWNATIGEGCYCVHLPARSWGWNARSASQTYLAVEFAQPALSSPVTDAMVDAFAAWFAAQVAPWWPGLSPATMALPMHSELPEGAADGKTDAFTAGSAEAFDLRRRIRVSLQPQTTYPTADLAFDAYCRENAENPLWAGKILGRGHWLGPDPLSLCRTDVCLLGYDGARAVDVTPHALDDFETWAKADGALQIY